MSKEHPCVHYGKNGVCRKFSDDEVVSYCVLGPCDDETPSRGDWIRAMSDEDMAIKLPPLFEELFSDGVPSPEYMLSWFQQPAEARQ